MENLSTIEVQIENQIQEIEREELRLDTELLDAFADVTTPEGSEDEDETPIELNHDDPNNPSIILLQKMLQAKSEPKETSRYSVLYRDEHYRQNVKRKMTKMKNLAKNTNIDDIIDDDLFTSETDRIKNLYQDDGGRIGLYELIGLYCHLDNKKADITKKEE